MTFADLSPLANHIWQSTLFAAAAWVLALAMRKNRASVRYWIWLAASVKFLIPFSLLVVAGAQLGWRTAPVIAPSQLSFAMDEISQPFAMPAPAPLPSVPVPAQNPLPAILVALWLCGMAVGIVFWLRWWRQLRSIRCTAMPVDMDLPIHAMSSSARMEPGVVGILKPVLLLPEGIAKHLTPAQLQAILAHELCHVQRRDNLTAAVHMLVETIFWFHPLVWWIRTRLMEERERACDEGVLRLGGEPQVYAESILRVCEFYLASPVACAAGVTGGELRKRIEGIMANRFTRGLSYGKKVILAVAATLAIAGPVVVGLMNPPGGRAAPQSDAKEMKFEVASVKPASPGFTNGIRVVRLWSGGPGTPDPGLMQCTNCPLSDLVKKAYDLENYQLPGAASLNAEFLISAKLPTGATQEQARLMLQNLLAERLKLKVHWEKKDLPGYALVVGKGGPKLKASAETEPASETERPHITLNRDLFPVIPPGYPANGIMTYGNGSLRSLGAGRATMAQLATELTSKLSQPVLDETGLKGKYDFTLYWALEPLDPASPPERLPPPEDLPLPTLSEALRKVGLNVQSRKVPGDVLIVDHVERVPTEN